ncbi:hypothetical protein ACFQVA_10455 [Actinomadura keratinilytica]
MPWALEAQRILAEEWGVRADVWSATSWNELRREAIDVERYNLLHPDEEQRVPYVTQKLSGSEGPSWRSPTGCARSLTRSPAGCPGLTSRSAPTGSASPTPGARPGGSSTSTRSRSCWPC